MGGSSSEDSTNWAEVLDPALGYCVTVPCSAEVRKMERVIDGVQEEKFFYVRYYQRMLVMIRPGAGREAPIRDSSY